MSKLESKCSGMIKDVLFTLIHNIPQRLKYTYFMLNPHSDIVIDVIAYFNLLKLYVLYINVANMKRHYHFVIHIHVPYYAVTPAASVRDRCTYLSSPDLPPPPPPHHYPHAT